MRRRRINGMFARTEEAVEQLPRNLSVAITDNRAGLGTNLTYLRETLSMRQDKEQVSTDTDTSARGSFRDELDKVHHSLQWVVEDVSLPEDNGAALAEAIRANQGRCMSDGSLKDLFGTSGFVSMLKDEQKNYAGTNRIPGEDNDQSSYRSELVGLLANVIIHNALCRAHNITDDHEIIIGCDNESAIWTAFGDDHIAADVASSDILHAIHYQIKASPLKWTTKWVQGHQDNKKQLLDTWALANIACDAHAGPVMDDVIFVDLIVDGFIDI